jgi:Putative transposase
MPTSPATVRIGTSSVDLAPLALIARLAALIPPPRRHVVRYSGVISSHSSLPSQVLGPAHPATPARGFAAPVAVPVVPAPEENDKPSLPLSHYISWSQLLKKTFEIDTVCPRCKNPLRLIAMIETEDTIKKILSAMGLPTCAPKLWPARPPPSQSGGEGGGWLN